ncbi:two-component system, sporulation sensor kinase A [Lentibacillus persicus]|uniref:histidine kinase n=1 Tax=Lentibacillus persicus TaxID=640948 RepID=A0A1I1V5P1_9BACI|nr:ATP-binding protein [Lentibacillus persicus]SFD78362.1 two-component system, sporulation sensor kinase A [Lentibacillus persicus]
MDNNYLNGPTDSRENEHRSTIPQNLHEFYNLASLPSSVFKWMDQNMTGFIVLWGLDGTALYISKTAEEILGYPISEMLGTKWYDWIPPSATSYIKNSLKLTQNINQTFHLKVRDFTGESVWTENKVTAIEDANGNKYYVSATKDITDKRDAEELMARSEQLSVAGQLAAGIAHEIRNPLTSIKGFLQLLQAGVNREEEYYKIMVDEIEKIEKITSELLFISKPMTDYKKIENVSEMINDVVTLLAPQAKLKNIILLWEQHNGQSVICDRSQLKQVFINLLKNAIEAMDRPGSITINNYLKNNEIYIDIIDEGTGIPDEIMTKLGEPFFTTKQNGTGLGLMITRHILERHGGKLEALRNKTLGSTFRVILPTP